MAISFNHKSKLSTVGTGSYVFRHYGVGGGGSLTYTYTGTVEERDITFEGTDYKILMLTTDGDLSFSRPVTCDIWACGGGSNGAGSGNNPRDNYGGAGGEVNELDASLLQSINVVIGQANVESGTIITGDISLTAAGKRNTNVGNTPGGCANTSTVYAGGGISTYPFSDTVNFQPHCAGGGGGAFVRRYSGNYSYTGGQGASNGGNTTARTNYSTHTTNWYYGASGGTSGGGTGGNGRVNGSSTVYVTDGGDATFFGSGGGGGGVAIPETWSARKHGAAGKGYQGVCYIRIPASEF